jgi:hypothetical protein
LSQDLSISHDFLDQDSQVFHALAKKSSTRDTTQSHRRNIVSATLISQCWPNNQLYKTYYLHYISYQFENIIDYFKNRFSSN